MSVFVLSLGHQASCHRFSLQPIDGERIISIVRSSLSHPVRLLRLDSRAAFVLLEFIVVANDRNSRHQTADSVLSSIAIHSIRVSGQSNVSTSDRSTVAMLDDRHSTMHCERRFVRLHHSLHRSGLIHLLHRSVHVADQLRVFHVVVAHRSFVHVVYSRAGNAVARLRVIPCAKSLWPVARLGIDRILGRHDQRSRHMRSGMG